MLTNLGVRRSWKRLINGECGIVSVKDRGPQFEQQTCQVAAAVPQGSKEDGGWNASDWLSRDDQRKMAQYAQYAIVAAQEALDDAGWYPKTSYDQEMTGVCIGSGIGSLEDIYDTSLAYDKGS
ncbi:beta-ketoacyl synthase [Lasallia pustulata]|uniref:beta-ketoacyl-[acyl-carrier-protein] synthase I n=1 Tax=Lasallia pustulata TaxID=136370 RepID=A0A1W5D0G8_9LECA|nr:beta-ketoacyl synthase [Lasallia pustulata]